MANKPLKSIKFPELPDTYTVPEVDSTLTGSGKAADAKAVGDQLGDLKSIVKQNETHIIAIESGTFSDNNGAQKIVNVKRLRNVTQIPVYDLYSITLPDGYSGWFFRLNKNGEYISAYNGWQSGTVRMTTVATADTAFINIGIRKTAAPNDDISADAATVEAGISRAYTSEIELMDFESNTIGAINAENRLENRLAFDASGTFSNAKMSVGVSNSVITINDNAFGSSVYLELSNPINQISGASSATKFVTLKANRKYRLRTIPISGTFNGNDSYIVVAISSGETTGDYSVTARGGEIVFSYDEDTTVSPFVYIRYETTANVVFQYELTDITDIVTQQDLNEIKATLYPQIPSYFESQIATVKENVRSDLQTVGRHGDNFIFITDIHWPGNFKHSPELVRSLAEDKLVNMIINGGDLIDGNTNKAAQIQLMSDCIVAFNRAGIPMLTAVGNHDYNSGYGTSDNYFTTNEYFATAQHQNALEGMVYGGDTYFYWDKVSTKTRYIVLDSGANNIGNGTTIPSEQITWIQGIIGNTPADYHIIVVVHDLGNYSSGTNPIDENNPFVLITGAQTLFDALDALLSTHMIEAIFFGHTHYDSVTTTSGGIPLISTNSDAKWQYYGMTEPSDGTVDSQCFDVVTIDYQADGNGKKHIYMRRVGRGSDRTIEY